MKHWVIGDIHGQYFALRALLDKMDIENDDITFLGDYIDWGKYSIQTLLFMIKLTEKQKNIKCLIGNHDKMMIDSLNNSLLRLLTSLEISPWGQNGGRRTLRQFEKLTDRDKAKIINWLKSLEYTREVEINDSKFYLAHAYPYVKELRNGLHNTIWKRLKPRENPFRLMGERYKEHKLICGHTISNNFTKGSYDVFFEDKFIVLDCGAKVLTKYPKKAKLAAICLEDLQLIYIDCLDADKWRWDNMKDWDK